MIIDGEEWDTEGLPAWMLRDLPIKAEVEVTQLMAKGRVFGPGEEFGTPTLTVPCEGGLLCTWRSHQPLERDGNPLTVADRTGWTPGEAEGWRPTKLEPARAGGTEIIDV